MVVSSPRDELRCVVPSSELLQLLIESPLPCRLQGGAVRRQFHRDEYYDTPDDALRRRRVLCRIRHHTDGTRELAVLLPRDARGGDAAAQVTGDAGTADASELWAGDSPPVRQLRAMVDPDTLVRRFDVETVRTLRAASGGWLRWGRFDFVYDELTLREGNAARSFYVASVVRRRIGSPDFAAIARAFEEQYGLRAREHRGGEEAESLLQLLRPEGDRSVPGAGRQLALVVLKKDVVALRRTAAGWRLPGGPGHGETAARRLLREWFGSTVGELARIGTVAIGGSGSLEVWVAHRVRDRAARGSITWLPLGDALANAATQAADAATAAALGLVAAGESGAQPSEPDRGPGDLLDPVLGDVAFIARVLAMAEDDAVPLLERLRYVSIVSSNIDELVMKHLQVTAPVAAAIEEVVRRQETCLARCLAALASAGVRILRWSDVPETARARLSEQFRREWFPLLTPRAITVSPGHPFPTVPPLTLSLAISLGGPGATLHFAYVRIPSDIPRFVPVPGSDDLIPVEAVVSAHIGRLYPDRDVDASYLFRITRLGELELQEARSGDLLQAVEEELGRRPLNPVVRLEVERAMPERVRAMLLKEFRFEPRPRRVAEDSVLVQEVGGLMALGDLRELCELPLPGGTYPAFSQRRPLDDDRSIWAQLDERDILVHHPYDAYGATVVRLLADAAADPDVTAIRMTLYRAGDRSPLVEALRSAARAGKDVSVVVELRARLDEERNVGWVKRLQGAGANVVYGVVGFKNHAKVMLITRRHGGSVRRYAHVGTGNYNAVTAERYTDFGLLSSDPELADDLHDLFNQLTGSTAAPRSAFRRLLVAPGSLLPGLLSRIEREIGHAEAGRGGHLRAKINGLDDEELARALYRASAAGVRVDLIVRGRCILRPGVPGLSEHIRVRSILGRFLEHGRVYHFANAGDPEYFIASADWRRRNLRERVEVASPVLDPASRAYLDGVLQRELADPAGWELGRDGEYRRAGDRRSYDPSSSAAPAASTSSSSTR